MQSALSDSYFFKENFISKYSIIFHKEVVIVKGSIIVSSMYWNRVILERKYYITIVLWPMEFPLKYP